MLSYQCRRSIQDECGQILGILAAAWPLAEMSCARKDKYGEPDKVDRA